MSTDSFQPSDRQIWDHVVWAIEALEAGEDHVLPIADKHDDLAFRDLGVDNMNDVLSWVLTFLREIKEIGPRQCFIYHGWAERCKERDFSDIFLYPYTFYSQHFDFLIYLKFGIRKSISGSSPHLYCHLDIHESNHA